jgi:hypothetical protein
MGDNQIPSPINLVYYTIDGRKLAVTVQNGSAVLHDMIFWMTARTHLNIAGIRFVTKFPTRGGDGLRFLAGN